MEEKFKKVESIKEKKNVKLYFKLIILVLVVAFCIYIVGIYSNNNNMFSSNLKFSQLEQQIINDGEASQETLEITQDISKYINVGNSILVQQDIYTSLNGDQNRKQEVLNIVTPNIEGRYPEDVKVLINGTKLDANQMNYDNTNGTLLINNTIATVTGRVEYNIIYLYAKNESEESESVLPKMIFTLNAKTTTLLDDDKYIEQESAFDVETEAKGSIVDIQKTLSGEVYKGYMYNNASREVSYVDTDKICISKADETDTLNITQGNTSFVDVNNNLYDPYENIIYKSTLINKDQLNRLFGDNYEIVIETSEKNEEQTSQDEQSEDHSSEAEQTEEENSGNKKIVITKDTEADENGNIVINYENEVYYIIITTSKPINEGHLVVNNVKAIKGNGDYNKELLKSINRLVSSSNVLERENNSTTEATIELKEPTTEAKISVNPKDLSIMDENTNTQISVLLKTDNEKYELYKDPYLEIKLPEDTEKATVNSIDLFYNDDDLKLTNSDYSQEDKTIKIRMSGAQTRFKSQIEEGLLVQISLDIKFRQDIPTKEIPIVLTYTNENAGDQIFETSDTVKLNAKPGTVLYNNVTGYNEINQEIETIEDSIVDANLNANVQEMQPSVHQAFINNYDIPLDNVKIIGTLKNDDTENDNIDITLSTLVSTSKENAVIYYSNKENIPAEDESWVTDIAQLNEIKSYKIELPDNLEPYEKVDINYNLRIPEGLPEGKESNYQTQATFTYQGMELNNNTITTFKTPDVPQVVSLDNGLNVEYLARSAGQNIKAGDEIYDGQAIEYTVTLTNNTGRNLSNIQLTAKHTNAVYYIETSKEQEIPSANSNADIVTKKDYEAKQIEKTLESLPINQSATISYTIATNGNVGDEVSGKISIKASELENPEEITTDSYKIKESKLIVDIEDEMGTNQRLTSGDPISYMIKVTNNAASTLNDITLKVNHSKNLILDMPEDLITSLNITSVQDDYLIIKIPSLRSGSSCYSAITFILDEMKVDQNDEDTYVSVLATVGDETYNSRELGRIIEKLTANLSGEQFLAAEQKVVQNGDKLTYTARITNNDKKLVATNLSLSHTVTRVNAQIDSAYLKTNTGKLNAELDFKEKDNEKTASHATVSYDLQPGETIEYTANATIRDNPDSWYEDADNVVSSMSLRWEVDGFLSLNEVSVPYENQNVNYGTSDNPSNTPGNPDDPDNPNNSNNGQSSDEKHSISGMTWLDKNKNGKRDSGENGIPNLEVSLLNSETGSNVSTIKTGSEGTYNFDNLSQGKYILTFGYDANVYSPTQYHADGVSDIENSDIIQKQDNSQATTDILTLSDSDLTNIDAGFKENSKFDLSLNKAINKVTVKTGEGTKEQKYTKEKLVKSEVHSKQTDNAVVTIEYVIEVKNEGEIAGFVTDIKDNKPKDLDFNEKDNTGWKLGNDGVLHNTSLANKKIEAGQTVELKLILTKKGIGQIINTAEIAGATNDFSVEDQDSTPNNNKKNEDDTSSAEVIISVKTGLVGILIGTLIGAIIILVPTTIIIYKKKEAIKSNENNKE